MIVMFYYKIRPTYDYVLSMYRLSCSTFVNFKLKSNKKTTFMLEAGTILNLFLKILLNLYIDVTTIKIVGLYIFLKSRLRLFLSLLFLHCVYCLWVHTVSHFYGISFILIYSLKNLLLFPVCILNTYI